jgi:hypothetical protein
MGILDWFMPSPYSKAHTLLKKKNLIAQAMILNSSRKKGYTTFSKTEDSSTFTETHRDKEISMLVLQKVNIMAAASSVSRFKEAVEICNECGLIDGSVMFKQYVNLYEYYIKNYSKVGGPSSW